MRWFTISSIYETVRPFTYLLKVCGLNCDNSWSKIPASRRIWNSLLYIVLFIVFYSYITFVTIVILRLDTYYESLIVGHTENVFAVVLCLVVVYSVVFGYVSRNEVSTVLRMLHEVDRDLLCVQIRIDHQRQHLLLTVHGIVRRRGVVRFLY
ncbi:uncharacterized protein LOC131680891, partial [Topomyia yanbarensis]|uniref:uncharacterized protein LOC131680891 n=1 Tax=Topomyia yanbarensis TaxID=2498891 RepID=UPI00273AB9B9